MTDIATCWNTTAGVGDFTLSLAQQILWTDEDGNSVVDELGKPVSAVFTPGSGLLVGDELLTAVLISLFTDAQADGDDLIPDGSDDPRGWWAGGIGSKIWLRLRSRATPLVLAQVKNDIEQALAWLIEDGVVTAIEVLTEWTRPRLLGARVVLRRSDGTRRALQFSRLWETI